MKKVKISRAKVLKAIATEPLFPGMFFRAEMIGTTITKKKVEECAVCAVGAVLRNHLSSTTLTRLLGEWDIGARFCQAEYVSFGSYSRSVQKAREQLKEKNYLGALSIRFEGLCAKNQLGVAGCEDNELNPTVDAKALKRVRTALARYVKTNFPRNFTVEY